MLSDGVRAFNDFRVQPWFRGLGVAVRALKRNWTFTIAAVLTLSIGVAASTAVLSVVDAVLFRPLPYGEPHRLVEVNESHRRDATLESYLVSGPNYRDWKERCRSFAGLSAYQWKLFRLDREDQSYELKGALLSSDLLPLLGVKPLLGRAFLSEGSESPSSVWLGFETWQKLFQGDRSVIGKSVRLNSGHYTIVGVMPPAFEFPGRTQLWAPLEMGAPTMQKRGARVLGVVGRLGPGLSPRSAQAELETISRQLEERYPGENQNWSARVTSLRSNRVAKAQTSLLYLVVTGTVLFLASLQDDPSQAELASFWTRPLNAPLRLSDGPFAKFICAPCNSRPPILYL
jgi:hypothetical protein